MSPSHVSPAGLVTRQRRRFRSCSIDITAYHLAGTEHPDALTAAKRKGTFRKKRSPISLSAATPRRGRFLAPLRPRGMSAFGGFTGHRSASRLMSTCPNLNGLVVIRIGPTRERLYRRR